MEKPLVRRRDHYHVRAPFRYLVRLSDCPFALWHVKIGSLARIWNNERPRDLYYSENFFPFDEQKEEGTASSLYLIPDGLRRWYFYLAVWFGAVLSFDWALGDGAHVFSFDGWARILICAALTALLALLYVAPLRARRSRALWLEARFNIRLTWLTWLTWWRAAAVGLPLLIVWLIFVGYHTTSPSPDNLWVLAEDVLLGPLLYYVMSFGFFCVFVPAIVFGVFAPRVLTDIRERWPKPMTRFFYGIPAVSAKGLGEFCVRFVWHFLCLRPDVRQPSFWRPSGSYQAALIRLAAIELFNVKEGERPDYLAAAKASFVWFFYYAAPIIAGYLGLLLLLVVDKHDLQERSLILLAFGWWWLSVRFFIRETGNFTRFLLDSHYDEYVLPVNMRDRLIEGPPLALLLSDRWSNTALTSITSFALLGYIAAVGALVPEQIESIQSTVREISNQISQ